MQNGNIGPQNKQGNLAGKFTFLFQGKITKRIKPSKCSKTNLQTSLIPQFFHGDTPDPR